FEVQDIFFRFEFMALSEKSEVRCPLRPKKAVKIKHVPRFRMRAVREVDVFRSHRWDERHFVAVFDARDVRAYLMIIEDLFRESRIVALGRNGISHQIEVFRIERINILGNSTIQSEHVAKPIGVFRAATILKLFEEEAGSDTTLLV